MSGSCDTCDARNYWLASRYMYMALGDYSCHVRSLDVDSCHLSLFLIYHSQAGGRFVAAAPSSPDDLAELLDPSNPLRLDCDVLVNCTGLDGARDLWNDDSVYAVRGQVLLSDRLSDRNV